MDHARCPAAIEVWMIPYPTTTYGASRKLRISTEEKRAPELRARGYSS